MAGIIPFRTTLATSYGLPDSDPGCLMTSDTIVLKVLSGSLKELDTIPNHDVAIPSRANFENISLESISKFFSEHVTIWFTTFLQ